MAVETELPTFEEIWVPIEPTEEGQALIKEWEAAQSWARNLISSIEI